MAARDKKRLHDDPRGSGLRPCQTSLFDGGVRRIILVRTKFVRGAFSIDENVGATEGPYGHAVLSEHILTEYVRICTFQMLIWPFDFQTTRLTLVNIQIYRSVEVSMLRRLPIRWPPLKHGRVSARRSFVSRD